ncbi:uncharacterized protein METZ01_LOCUS32200 [marine metagenome]|uniref:Uncharacterized protein n=1 Tax=marine metagenome TaxID=408172 RepID=A0A381QJ46_9ZZZZ
MNLLAVLVEEKTQLQEFIYPVDREILL